MATYNQFKVDFKKDSIGVKVANGADLAAAIDENIKANLVKTIGNPRDNVAPIPELAKVVHDHDIPLILDSSIRDCLKFESW